jgi:hypothetical protein
MAAQPFFGRADISINDGELFGQSPLLTVPAGKQLIIEYLDGSINLPPGETVISVRLLIGGDDHHFGAVFQGTQKDVGPAVQDVFTVNHLMRVYAAPGKVVQVDVNRSAKSGGSSAVIAVTGHFVDFA